MKTQFMPSSFERKQGFAVRTLVIIGLTLAMAAPLIAANDDYTAQLSRARLLSQPLVWVGATPPGAEESRELWETFGVGSDKKIADTIDGLTAFMEAHPHSPWIPSLNGNLGNYYRERGYFSLALEHWQAAWDATKDMTDLKGRQVADYALVNWLSLLASLGRTDTMKELFTETHERHLGPLQTLYDQSREGYFMMMTHPDICYRCGTYALNAVAQALYKTNLFREIGEQPSPSSGFSMAALLALSQSNHLDMVAVERPDGQNDIVVPSVVHWKLNHYAAIISKRGNLYEVVDPTFRMHKWLTGEAINAESSGQFLVAAKQVPDGWQRLNSEQASHIFGKGYPSIMQPEPCPCNCPPPCPPGSSGSGGNGSGNGSDGLPGSCSSCDHPTIAAGAIGASSSSEAGAGMPNWKVNEPYIDLRLRDVPLGYQSSAGPVSFEIDYWQRDSRGPNPYSQQTFGMGPSWECSWLAYVNGGDGEVLNGANGGQIPLTDPTGTTPNYYYNLLTTETTTNFIVSYPSGAKDIYGFEVYNQADEEVLYYLTQKIDERGRTTTFVYVPFDPLTNPVAKLLYVIDADGRTNTISYTSVSNSSVDYEYLVSQVKDPNGDTVNFAYDTNGCLTNVTDMAGISSSFTYGYSTNVNYDGSGDYWINSLNTPYGTTTFALFDYTYQTDGYLSGDGSITDDFGGDIIRSAIVTQPDGGHQMFIYEDASGFLPSSYDSASDPTNYPAGPPADSELDGSFYMNLRNTFYWSPRQFDNLSAAFLATGATNWDPTRLTTNDYTIARLQHWNHIIDSSGQSDSLSMEQDPSPNGSTAGKMTWYDYPGRYDGSGSIAQGTSTYPSLVIKVLPDGSDWYQQNVADQWGNFTNVINTYSVSGTVYTRTNRYVYASNGNDLLLSIGPDGVTNAAYSYDSNHQVLFMTNALGEVIGYTYNANEQITNITQPNGLVTANIYDVNGFLAQQIITGISTNSYTYTNGLVYTHTDERGLITTNTWDALERLTSTFYPDGSYVSNVYTFLDRTAAKDRMGNWTTYIYDSMRRNTVIIDALDNAWSYNYCTCGALESIRDADDQTTSFYYDNQGNLTNTVYPDYPDFYSVTRNYNLLRQVTSVVDTSGNSITSTYNNQGLLTSVSNTVGQVAAYAYDIDDRLTNSVDANGASITNTYDNLNRLLTRGHPDGGVEHWGYTNKVAGPTCYTNQIGNVVTYAYDAMNRKTNEVTVGVSTTGFAYDAASDLITLTDGNNHTTTWAYDQYGRVTNKVDNLGTNDFVYKYDSDNRLTNRWTPAMGNTAYGYDTVGNLTQVTYPVSPSISFGYDPMNRLTSMVDGVGTTTYNYDVAGKLLSEGGLWPNDTVSYTYNNRLRTGLSVQAPNASAWTQSYSYDTARRLTNLTSPAGTFGYTYDAVRMQRVDELSLPNGAYITNTYDDVARLTSTALESSGNTDLDSYAYGYNQAGQRTNVTRTLGDFVSYTYDNEGELKTALGKVSGGATNRWQEQFGYTYDAAGNLNYRTNNALIQTFNLNSLNELLAIDHSGTLTVAGTTTSPATNVTVNTSNAVLYADATFASTNQPLTNSVTNSFTAIAKDGYGRVSTNTVSLFIPTGGNHTYDLNGNLQYEYSSVGGTNRQFTYDDENELTSVMVASNWQSQFVYDGKMRRRIERDYAWNGSSWTETNEIHFIYDGNVVIQERDINNLPKVTYTRGNDLSGTLQGAGGIGGLLARSDNTQMIVGSPTAHAYYHADGNGNVTMLINYLQAIEAKYLYDPFGNTLSLSGSLAEANVYRFSSKEWNDNAGLYYYLYRYYDPNLQRWPNRDPLGEPGFETLHLVSQPLFIRKLRLGINDSEVQFLLANAMQSGSIDVSSYLRNSHTHYAGSTISAVAFLNLLRNGQGSYAPNWPVELLEYPNLFDFVGNDPLDGIDPFGLWHWYNPVSWDWGMIWDWSKTTASAGNDTIDKANMANDTMKCLLETYPLENNHIKARNEENNLEDNPYAPMDPNAPAG
jgi:RHS repeat-associated protein